MLIKEQITEKVFREELKNIKCDICGKNLLKGKRKETEVGIGTLMFSKTTVGSAKELGIDEAHERESSDLCEKCYRLVIAFLKKEGGKVPSYFYSEENEIDERIAELLLS